MTHRFFGSFLSSFGLLFTSMLLSGCGKDDSLNFARDLPDEFAIVSLRPLTLPPDYALRAPDSKSESQFSVNQLQDNVRASLLNQTRLQNPIVSDDSGFLRAAKADKREIDILRLLEEENLQAISEPLSVAEAIAFEESFPETVRGFFRVKAGRVAVKKVE